MGNIKYFKDMQGKFLEDRVSIITGASKGLGREIALTFAKLGSKLVITCVNNEILLKEVAKEVKEKGAEVMTFVGDLSLNKEGKRLINETVTRFGGIDILVNNAGITDPRPFEEITETDWDKMTSINLKSLYNCTYYAMPYLKKSGKGRILSMSSVCGKSGGIGAGAHYSAVKAGVIGFTKSLACQFSQYGVTANSIAPAMINTEMITWRSDDLMKEHVNLIPLKRIGQCNEVSEPAAFLCSDYASFITGYCMDVNGGLYMD